MLHHFLARPSFLFIRAQVAAARRAEDSCGKERSKHTNDRYNDHQLKSVKASILAAASHGCRRAHGVSLWARVSFSRNRF